MVSNSLLHESTYLKIIHNFTAVVNKSIEVNIVHTYKYKKSSHHSPYDLVNIAPSKVEVRGP